MLLPLGPELSASLRFPAHELGYLSSVFLFAAAIAGLAGALIVDRFDRRVALATTLAGLAISTGLAALATSLDDLMVCRLLAGLCGGPAAAIGLAIVGDTTASAARARAMGVVAAGSSFALIMGVPLALTTADLVGWRAMMVAAAAFGLVLAVFAVINLPTGLGQRRRQNFGQVMSEFAGMLRLPSTLILLAMTALTFSSTHVMAANLATFIVHNLGYDESELKYIWMVGGGVGLCSSQANAFLASRVGAIRMFWWMSAFAVVVFWLFFVKLPVTLPAMLLFGAFLVSVNGRIVLVQTISSLVSRAETRGRFMSLAGAVNQGASGLMLIASSQVLGSTSRGALTRMPVLGWFGIVAIVVSALLAWALRLRLTVLQNNDRPRQPSRFS